MMGERANLRSLWLVAKIQHSQNRGLGLPEHCAGRAAERRGSTVWMGKAGDWVLEGWRFADSPVSLRGSIVGGQESLLVVVGGPGKSSGRPRATAGIAGGSVVLWGFH